jgi:hypothetical protein
LASILVSTCGDKRIMSWDHPAYGAPVPPMPPSPIGSLGTATTIVLGASAAGEVAQAVIGLGRGDTTPMADVNLVIFASIAPSFLVWFYRARKNAGLWGPQSRSQGWTIGAWFTPVVNLWFPIQIMRDIWRTSAGDRSAAQLTARLAAGWWICWILAWLTGLQTGTVEQIGPDGSMTRMNRFGLDPGSRPVSSLCLAAAATLLALVVGKVTAMQVARSRPGPGSETPGWQA